MEADLEGNIPHVDEWSMSTTPPHIPLLSVLLSNFHVQAMSHYLKSMYHPSFIHSYLSHLNSKSRTVCCVVLLTSRAISHQSSKTIQDLQDPQEPSRLKNSKSVQGRVILIRHQSRETLVVALVSEHEVRPKNSRHGRKPPRGHQRHHPRL